MPAGAPAARVRSNRYCTGVPTPAANGSLGTSRSNTTCRLTIGEAAQPRHRRGALAAAAARSSAAARACGQRDDHRVGARSRRAAAVDGRSPRAGAPHRRSRAPAERDARPRRRRAPARAGSPMDRRRACRRGSRCRRRRRSSAARCWKTNAPSASDASRRRQVERRQGDQVPQRRDRVRRPGRGRPARRRTSRRRAPASLGIEAHQRAAPRERRAQALRGAEVRVARERAGEVQRRRQRAAAQHDRSARRASAPGSPGAPARARGALSPGARAAPR